MVVGSFAATPESFGKFYQWNRKVAWATTGSVTGWDGSRAEGTEWAKANDPSPIGWRVPTSDELQSLLYADRAWDAAKKGYTFTDRVSGNSIFLPATGARDGMTGTLFNAGMGLYWSSTSYGYGGDAYILNFGDNFANLGGYPKNSGYPVR